ncbi:MerR family transcriptional regulator [Streptomyces sp. NPDC049097]|uniref:MerR family transcriptional regulator n=1 Tax=Streptomyces sp. NPDC049097 TaxID=3155497 RepID=UPI00341BF894
MTSAEPVTPGGEPTLTIAQVAERTGLTHDTLRYYEKAGLIERVGRTGGNQRRYAAADLAWLEFLLRLRETGMPIAEMQRFAALRSRGDATVADRLAMLREHRAAVARRIRACAATRPRWTTRSTTMSGCSKGSRGRMNRHEHEHLP